MERTDKGVRVISDAGPVIHLDELGCLDLLADFPRIIIPHSVWNEVAGQRPSVLTGQEARLARMACSQERDIRLREIAELLSLHLGETDALALAQAVPSSLLLTDDAAARLAAEILGVRVHGTVGIVIRAVRRGQRSREQVVEILREIPRRSSLHIRPSLLAEIVRRVAGER